MSSAKMVELARTSGTSPSTMRLARPSAIAVLPTPGIAHIQRVVLGAAAEDLDGALDLRLAADQRVDLPGHRLLVQVHAVVGQRVLVAPVRLLLPLLLRVAVGLAAAATGALDRPLSGAAGRLGDAVADEVHRVEPGHVLELQEVDRVAFAFGEQRHQHVGAGDFVAAGGLHVDRRPLHHALEPGGGLRVARPVGGQAGQVLVEELAQVGAQLVEVDPAGAQHRRRVGVVRQARAAGAPGWRIRAGARSPATASGAASVRGSVTAWWSTLLGAVVRQTGPDRLAGKSPSISSHRSIGTSAIPAVTAWFTWRSARGCGPIIPSRSCIAEDAGSAGPGP